MKTFDRALSLVWPAASHSNLLKQIKVFISKEALLHCFGTPIWLPERVRNPFCVRYTGYTSEIFSLLIATGLLFGLWQAPRAPRQLNETLSVARGQILAAEFIFDTGLTLQHNKMTEGSFPSDRRGCNILFLKQKNLSQSQKHAPTMTSTLITSKKSAFRVQMLPCQVQKREKPCKIADL